MSSQLQYSSTRILNMANRFNPLLKAPHQVENFRPFDKISEEIVQSVFCHLLIYPKAISLDSFIHPNPRFTTGWTLLRVSKRFHRIAEYIIYRQNTFSTWDHTCWPKIYLRSLKVFAFHAIEKLAFEWPNDRWTTRDDQQTINHISGFSRLKSLEMLSFPQHIDVEITNRLANLPVKEIWFHHECKSIPDLTSSVGIVRRLETKRNRVIHRTIVMEEPVRPNELDQGYIRL